MFHDLRYALRTLRRAPAFALLASLTLAIGIGANSAIFSVAWQVLLKPLPFPDEDRLVVIWEAYGPNRRLNPVSPGSFTDWREQSRSFDAVAAYNLYPSNLNLTGVGEPRQVTVTYVTGDFFNVLRVPAIVGRAIQPSDMQGDAAVIALGAKLWRSVFNADPSIVGRVLRLDGEPFEVVGVLPDDAAVGTQAGDAWVRLPFGPARARMRQAHYLGVIARMKPGVTPAQADAEVQAIAARAAAAFPMPNGPISARVREFREQLAGGVRQPVLVLFGAAALVLLAAGANLAGLQLARHTNRARIIAVRAALGASPLRLFREFLAEGLIVASAAAYGGLLLATWALASLGQLAPSLLARDIAAAPDATVVAFTVGLALAAGVLLTAAPAWRAASRTRVSDLNGRGSNVAGGARVRAVLVAVEVALAVIVLTGAALLVSSLVRVLRVDPGFEFGRGLVVDLALPATDYPTAEARARFFDRAIARVQAIPGVERACGINAAPLVGAKGGMTYVADGQTRMVGAQPSTITPGCLDVLRIPVRQGRGFREREPEPAALISESMARELWPDADPIGQRMHVGLPDGPVVTVVGVVGNIHHISLESVFANQVWMPHTASWFPTQYLLVRTGSSPAGFAAAVKQAVRELDPNLPMQHVQTMASVRAEATAARRFDLTLLGGYGLVALALCGLGIYGLLAQVVSQRTQEIGIRMALGADARHVVRDVTSAAAISVAIGVTAGAGLATLLSRVLRHMLFHVSPTDPWLYAAVMLLVAIVATLAAYIPARRATRIDPLAALRIQ